MTFNDVYCAMAHLSETHDLDASYSAFTGDPRRLDVIEAIAHELAHALCLGGVQSTDEFQRKIRRLSNVSADQHELTALRVEVAALRQLGVRVDGRRLCAIASFRNETPTLARMQDPLTVAEQGLVGWFVSIVREAAKTTKRGTP
jgi:beta-xylosidase